MGSVTLWKNPIESFANKSQSRRQLGFTGCNIIAQTKGPYERSNVPRLPNMGSNWEYLVYAQIALYEHNMLKLAPAINCLKRKRAKHKHVFINHIPKSHTYLLWMK
jgi:hypothetical protein